MTMNKPMNSKKRPSGRRRTIAAWFTGLAVLFVGLSAAVTGFGAGPDWTLDDMPSQQGRIYVITGGTSGIGFETAKALARSGAWVLIASRNEARGREAVAAIREAAPGARVQFERLDLGDLASVHALAERLNATLPHLDVLINNAGIMEPPQRGVSANGFELQFAVNYLGHYALTAELLPLLRKSKAPRVVTQSSIAAIMGRLQFDDLQFEREYAASRAYGQSKLACLMFALELQRRSDASGWGIQSIAAHPGLSRTELQAHHSGPRRLLRLLFQSAEQGALPTLYAATSPAAQGGDYYGPNGLLELRGHPADAGIPSQAQDEGAASRLWAESERLTGVVFRPALSR